MATYKVPQDVEAEDKLLGPFSFRQFVYLGIALGSAALAFFLFQVFPLLGLAPLPVTLLFGILALPLRKDQPMETYLIALIRFYLKPKLRKWDPEGVISYVEIIAPKLVEYHLTKEYNSESAQERLDYLARVMDSRGWSYKKTDASTNESVNSTVVAEANATVDIMDENQTLSRSFKEMIDRKTEEQRQAAIDRMKQATVVKKEAPPQINYNPYPASMHQKVILPPGQQKPVASAAPKPAVTPPVSPDIMRLATNKDLSVSAIAHEAQRLDAKKGEEVIIKLH